jgi:hypothetical protein
MIRRRSSKAPRMAASAAVTGEPSRDAVVATGSQQEDAAAAASQVLVPNAPSQGCRQARPESRPVGGREAVGDAADDDAPPGGANWGASPRQPLSACQRC